MNYNGPLESFAVCRLTVENAIQFAYGSIEINPMYALTIHDTVIAVTVTSTVTGSGCNLVAQPLIVLSR